MEKLTKIFLKIIFPTFKIEMIKDIILVIDLMKLIIIILKLILILIII